MTLAQVRFSHLEFDPSITMDSGQAFRWYPLDSRNKSWVGIISGNLIKLEREGGTILGRIENQKTVSIYDYLTANDDLDSIFSCMTFDRTLAQSRRALKGLRLLTQDPWECLISFICSINCNIPSIHVKIENLSVRFGKKIPTSVDFAGYSFPTPESLASAKKRDLLSCKLGFRWRYVKFLAKQVVSGNLDLGKLSNYPYSIALSELISKNSGKTLGVGPKVADCTLLYSMHKTEAFPIDVWILRCLNKYYNLRGNTSHLSTRSYAEISETMRRKFGRYAGYAQLYLYVAMRSNSITQNTEQV